MIADYARVWRAMPKVVFSHTLESVDWNARLERGDPVDVVTKLKAETEGQLEIAGATLAAPVVRAGLVDEYRIVLVPTAVGGAYRTSLPCRRGSPYGSWRTARSRAGRSCCAMKANATDRSGMGLVAMFLRRDPRRI